MFFRDAHRYWLLTWTTYGTWLPGDPRGCVTRVREGAPPQGPRIEHDEPLSIVVRDIPGLVQASRIALRATPVRLEVDGARIASASFRETAAHRGWGILAGAIMANHIHLVVCLSEDIDPGKLLQDFKSYASRALSKRFGQPASQTWWTTSGSRRRLTDETSLAAAIRYVQQQEYCLAQMEVSPDSGDSRPPLARESDSRF